jgi:hypothetical protein
VEKVFPKNDWNSTHLADSTSAAAAVIAAAADDGTHQSEVTLSLFGD